MSWYADLPTPLEVLFDPLSLAMLVLIAGLLVAQALWPGRQLPNVRGWWLRAGTVFVLHFYLAAYLPLLWDQYLLPYQVFHLENMNIYASTSIAILVFELLIYVWHRSMHSHEGLWRIFHQMHHSAERVDALGAFYFSPLDTAGFAFVGSLTLSVLVGLAAEAVTLFLMVTLFLATFQHTNVKTPQWLGYLIQRPESHSVHHQAGLHRYNYSDLPLFDIAFGTFHNPKEFAAESGFYDGASSRFGDMLLCRDVSVPKELQDAKAPSGGEQV